jgi:hypothetical protein
MALPKTSSVAQELPERMRPALAPLRKNAFGLATGVAGALLLGVATLVLAIRGGDDAGAALGRLGLVFRGYDVSYGGTPAGFFYGFASGFAGGWMLAACRNVLIAVHVFFVGARERARASGSVLDDLS